MRKSLSGIFEYWKSFRFINLIPCVCVCVELWVNRIRRELRPCGLKLNVLFSSVWKPWEQFYRQIKQNECQNCLQMHASRLNIRGKSGGKLITADHPWQTFRRKCDLTWLNNHNHHGLCILIQQRLGLSLLSVVIFSL